MARIKTLKTNFTAGEIGRGLMGRGDLRAYANGAARLRNVLVMPTGGATRRPGLRRVATAAGDGRLIAFEFNTEQTYLIAVTGWALSVFSESQSEIAQLGTPWGPADIAMLSWTQSADNLLLVHPNHAPKRLVRTGATTFELRDWVYVAEGGRIQQPHHKFVDPAVTLQASATTGAMTLTASAGVFNPAHVGLRFRLQNKEVLVTGYTSPTQASASAQEPLASTQPTSVWSEQAFSPVRGYPTSCVFHQDRLVIGGSRDLPHRLWLSKSADLYNFDLGTGEDDEAIEFAILSDQVNAIRSVFSGRHLQVLTSGAEWMAAGEPLTPTNIELKRQSRVGSPVDRYVPPRDVDGGTIFVSRDDRSLREFLFTDIEQAYEARDLASLVRHLVNAPRDIDYDPERRILFSVMANGAIGALTQYRQEEVTAWSLLTTTGAARSVAVAGRKVYFLISRNGGHYLEVLDDGAFTDCCVKLWSATPTTAFTSPALAHLNGSEVSVLADGRVHRAVTVAGQTLTLDEPVQAVEAGLPFTHEIAPLPVYAQSNAGGATQGVAVRLVRAVFRLLDSQALWVDVGRGPKPVPFARSDGLSGPVAPAPITADKTVRALGWTKGQSDPLWRVEQAVPLPCTLLSVMTEISANG